MPNYHSPNDVAINDSEVYEYIFESRGIDHIRQYRTKNFSKIANQKIKAKKHVWTKGDTLFRLSFKYYNDSSHWWIIGIINHKPTDAHYKIGDEIFVPIKPTEIKV